MTEQEFDAEWQKHEKRMWKNYSKNFTLQQKAQIEKTKQSVHRRILNLPLDEFRLRCEEAEKRFDINMAMKELNIK